LAVTTTSDIDVRGSGRKKTQYSLVWGYSSMGEYMLMMVKGLRKRKKER
jgi:hypothetical protein